VGTTRNVIIVGSGPAGYCAAIYTARADLAPLLIEGTQYGGALMQTTEVENYPGFIEGIQGPELMEAFRQQAARYGTEMITDDATSIELGGDVKQVTVGTQTHEAHALVLAMGSAYRRLGIPGEERLAGRGVSWCATCDGFFFRDQDIAVVGGGDSALEEALFLARFARTVTVIHRRGTLRASKIMQDRALTHPSLRFQWGTVVTEILGESTVRGLQLQNTSTGESSILAATGVFVAIGHDPRNELVRDAVPLDQQGYVLTEGRSTRTMLPGVFACGDLVDHTYRQAITAAGTGCSAALDVETYLGSLGMVAGAAADPRLSDAHVSATPPHNTMRR
jgi:thioredoxin reductase (NADPH)